MGIFFTKTVFVSLYIYYSIRNARYKSFLVLFSLPLTLSYVKLKGHVGRVDSDEISGICIPLVYVFLT